MSGQSSAARREAAIAAARKLGPMQDEVAEAIAKQRERFAEKRAARAAACPQVERRGKDRREGPFDRREGERRTAPEYPASEAQSQRINRRKFDARPELPTGFGDES